jgi:hypothetical protein
MARDKFTAARGRPDVGRYARAERSVMARKVQAAKRAAPADSSQARQQYWRDGAQRHERDSRQPTNAPAIIGLADIMEKRGAQQVWISVAAFDQQRMYVQLMRAIERRQASQQLPLALIGQQPAQFRVDQRIRSRPQCQHMRELAHTAPSVSPDALVTRDDVHRS